MPVLKITFCPTCGSRKIRAVRRVLSRTYRGKPYTVPNLEYYECPDCGERLFDRDAMRKIEKYSPAYSKLHARKKSA